MFKNLLSKIDGGRPFRWYEFRLIDWSMRHYVRGNFSAFGLWDGLRANITLMLPIVGTLWYIRSRHKTLTLAGMDKLQEQALINTVNKDSR